MPSLIQVSLSVSKKNGCFITRSNYCIELQRRREDSLGNYKCHAACHKQGLHPQVRGGGKLGLVGADE